MASREAARGARRDHRGVGPALRALGVAALACLALAGCPRKQAAPGAAPKAPQAAEGVSPADPQRARAEAAAKALGGRLKARLQEALAGGLREGIAVCKTAAPEVGAAVGVEERLRIGRTSHKLRNPSNRPPEWAKGWVTNRVEDPRFSRASDGTLRALLPIRMAGLCVACHGPLESLAPDVKSALAEHYAKDQATGFQDGDLRGWFWVEVPPG